MMKRLFLFFTSAITVAALAFSCEPTKPDDKPDEGKEGEDEVVENLITVDGEFDDWKDLKNVAVADLPDDEDTYVALLKMKAVADKANLYLYFEYQVPEGQTHAPMTLEFDTDFDTDTGFTDWLWADAGWDYAIESSTGFVGPTSFARMTDLKLVTPLEGNDGVARSWEPKNWKDGSAKGVKNKGTRTNDIIKFEMSIPRALLKIEKKGTIGVGAYVQDVDEEGNWSAGPVGLLPVDDGVSMTNLLEVKIP